MIGPLSRIVVRYLAGALVAYGLLDEDTGNMLAVDPDIILAVGVALGFAVEGFYSLAKSRGWTT